jgi:hypothetical protein
VLAVNGQFGGSHVGNGMMRFRIKKTLVSYLSRLYYECFDIGGHLRKLINVACIFPKSSIYIEMKLLPPALITCHVETRNFIMTREVPTGNRHLLKVDKNERKKAAVSPDQPK